MAAPLLKALAAPLQRFLRNYSGMVTERLASGAEQLREGSRWVESWSKLRHTLINCSGLTFHPVHNLLRRPLGYRLHDLVNKKKKREKKHELQDADDMAT